MCMRVCVCACVRAHVCLFVCTQGMARTGEQTWPAAGPELVPHLYAVVEIVERIR